MTMTGTGTEQEQGGRTAGVTWGLHEAHARAAAEDDAAAGLGHTVALSRTNCRPRSLVASRHSARPAFCGVVSVSG